MPYAVILARIHCRARVCILSRWFMEIPDAIIYPTSIYPDYSEPTDSEAQEKRIR